MRERQPHWVSGLVYLLMGWLVVFKLPELVSLLNPVALALLAVGGVCYTVGVPFYIAKTCVICTVCFTCGCSPAVSSSSWR